MTSQHKRRMPLLLTSLGAILLAVTSTLAAEPPSEPAGPPNSAPTADRHGPTIKDAYKNHFLIGMAGDLPGNYSDQELGLVTENFSSVTPENCMKPANVHPREDTWRFERPDALVKWCADNNLAIYGHTLVWHAQTNDWFFREGDKATVTQRMKDHIHTLVGRYKGKIRSWDVVNEAISDGGNAQTAQTENLRNSSWLQAMGPEFLTLAFKFAHEADPDAKLYYNDYGIEAGPKHASSMVLLKRLIEDRAPMAGFGQPTGAPIDLPEDMRVPTDKDDDRGDKILVPLGEVATAVAATGPSTIRRKDLQREVRISAMNSGRSLGEAAADIEAAAAALTLPPGYDVMPGGDSEELKSMFRNMLQTLFLAVIFIYLILASQFGSFFHPFAIMLSLPLSLVGVALALLSTGDSLNMMSMIGLIMLMGLVTKNAILLVDGPALAAGTGACAVDARSSPRWVW